jgi:hypothetical protein
MQLLCLFADATLVPGFSLKQLVDDSDLVVVGSVSGVREVGSTTVLLNAVPIPARQMAGEVEVEEVLKGAARSPRISLRYAITEQWVGYPSIPSGIRILFLKLTGDTAMVTNLYYPTLPAVAGIKSTGASAFDRTVSQLAAVLGSVSAPTDQKCEAIARLEGISSPAVISALEGAAKEKDPAVRLDAVTGLLERNEISVLPIAERVLLAPDTQSSGYQRHNLSYGIYTGVKSEGAIPILDRLLGSSDVEVRRAATMALRHTGSNQALQSLAKGLYDNDLQVRYFSVLGFSEITGQIKWQTSQEDYYANETQYLRYWRQWVRNSQLR